MPPITKIVPGHFSGQRGITNPPFGDDERDLTALLIELQEATNVLGETAADVEWHIDPVDGDDDEGDGSSVNPFKSFSCMLNIPYDVTHEVRLKPKAGSYTYLPEVFKRNYYGRGRVVIDASGETYPIVAGPYTLDSVTDVGDKFQGYATATDLKIVAEITEWKDDEHYPKFIHVLTGAWAGYILPIFKNTGNVITTFPDWYGFAPGDTFNIVDCPVQITIPTHFDVVGNSNGIMEFSGNPDRETPRTPAFLMSGVKINANGERNTRNPFRVDNISAVFSFCTFVNDDTTSTDFNKCILSTNKSALNAQNIESDTFDNPKVADWYMFAHQLAKAEGEISDTAWPDIEMSDCLVSMITCRGGAWSINKPAYTGGGFFTYSMCGNFQSNLIGFFDIGPIYIEQVGFTSTCIAHQAVGGLTIRAAYIQKGGQPLVVNLGGSVRAEWLKGNGAQITADYTLQIEKASTLIRTTTDFNLLGSLGAIEFLFDGSTHAAWPADGPPALTDGAGSIVITDL